MYTFQFIINNGNSILEVWGSFAGLVLFARLLKKKKKKERSFAQLLTTFLMNVCATLCFTYVTHVGICLCDFDIYFIHAGSYQFWIEYPNMYMPTKLNFNSLVSDLLLYKNKNKSVTWYNSNKKDWQNCH